MPIFKQEPSTPKDDDIVTFETYYDPMLAEIIRAKLEAAGIPCFLVDENMGSMIPAYNQGGGGIKLKVFVHDLERAKEIADDENGLLPGEDLEAER